jgi:NAD(P)-dependent dehydrogenase (short-subunit alcohol dehydrogenase family)
VSAQTRVALVTGAARGIGLGIARRLAAAGYVVALLDRDGASAERSAAAMRGDGANALGFACDVARYDAVDSAVAAACERLGPPDVLVNNAGTRHRARLEDLSLSDWNDEVAVNLSGAFHCTQVAGRRMLARKAGCIVNIASLSATSGHPLRGAYSPTKAGILGLTALTAVEWGPRGVRCNAISPGIIVSPAHDDVYTDEALREGRRAFVPLGRLGSPEDIGDVVVFLASDAARFVNGVNLPVDGGTSQGLISLIPTIGPDGAHLAAARDALLPRG